MAQRLTKRLIERLAAEADPARDTLVWDDEVPGLVLRLRSGSARFAFQDKHRGRDAARHDRQVQGLDARRGPEERPRALRGGEGRAAGSLYIYDSPIKVTTFDDLDPADLI
jgi:hypothetical protein